MKAIITTSLLGALVLAVPAVAQKAEQKVETQACVKANDALLAQVSEKITAKPSTAAEVVKQTIIQSKANAELVLQIVKTAVTAAPEQAEAIRKVALALAPDAEKEVEIVIASVLQGDQVAAFEQGAANAGDEPAGDKKPNKVWLSNYGALVEGTDGNLVNSIASHVQNTAQSPNANHNQGASVRGGTTVIIRPDPTTPVVP